MRKREPRIGGWRAAGASAIALFGVWLSAVTAAAATVNLSFSSSSASPVHVVVGDVINASVPPAPPPPPGWTVKGSLEAPIPTSSDSSILPSVSAGYDSFGTAHATFRAARAGTATIDLLSAAPEECQQLTSTSTSTVTSTATSSSTTSTTTATTTTTNPLLECGESAVAALRFTIDVSAAGTLGTST
ncbi:MAG TPA: hypothetical protein VF155_09735, partial [Candidatus Dormibacteraeota bacterium]